MAVYAVDIYEVKGSTAVAHWELTQGPTLGPQLFQSNNAINGNGTQETPNWIILYTYNSLSKMFMNILYHRMEFSIWCTICSVYFDTLVSFYQLKSFFSWWKIPSGISKGCNVKLFISLSFSPMLFHLLQEFYLIELFPFEIFFISTTKKANLSNVKLT